MAISDLTKEVAEAAGKHLTFNADSQQLEVGKDFMADVIPVLNKGGIEVTQEQMNATMKGINAVVAGTALATGELAVDKMSKKVHKDVQAFTATWNIAKGADVTHTVLRDFEARAPGKEETIIKHGRLETQLDIRGSKPKSGELKAIREALYTQAEEKFGAKS